MIAKIQREKSAAIKELIDKEESQIQANDDFRNKYNIEYEKLNTFLEEMISLQENYRLAKARYD